MVKKNLNFINYLFDFGIIDEYKDSFYNEDEKNNGSNLKSNAKGYFLTLNTKEALHEFFEQFEIKKENLFNPNLRQQAINEKNNKGFGRDSNIQIQKWVK